MMTVANTHEMMGASLTEYCSPVCTNLEFLQVGVAFIVLEFQCAH